MITARLRKALRQHRLAIAGLGLVSAMLVFHGHFRVAIVVGDSMLPTLHPGDVLLVDRRAYQDIGPRRGDIVVARYGGGLIVKRIVGLPGEELEVRRGMLYIDGIADKQNYRVKEGFLDVAKGKLLEGDFASLGDNRAIPSVLAIHPILSEPDILGKVVLSSGISHLAIKY